MNQTNYTNYDSASVARQVKPLTLNSCSAQVTTVDYVSSSTASAQVKPATFSIPSQSVPVRTIESAAVTRESNQVKPLGFKDSVSAAVSMNAPRQVQQVKPISQVTEKKTEVFHEHLVFKKLNKMLIFGTMLDNVDEDSEKVKKIVANCEAILMSCFRIAAIIFLFTHHSTWALITCAVGCINNKQ